jgi:zinc ribbon protein
LTTSSETSTDRPDPKDRAAFQPWQFYILLAMIGATAAVILSRNTHPLALLLLSAAVVLAGLAGVAFHRSLMGFFGLGTLPPARGERARATLEREKALILRSIKELEFDHKMGKVSDADFSDIGGRLRARALALMQDIERAGPDVDVMPVASKRPRSADQSPRTTRAGACPGCGTTNDADAKFCKQCGRRLGA